MYKLEDNRLRSAKTSDWLNGTPISNFPIYLQELPVEDRQALGWYTHVDYSTELTEATMSGGFDFTGAPATRMFYATFDNCSKLTGKSALMPDGVTYLYEQFSTASGTECDNCYLGAKGLDDYDDIPVAWK